MTPDNAELRTARDWLRAGFALYDARKWDEAAKALERGLAGEPGNARAWYRLGNAREEQGRDADAAACFERALALDPSHAKSWNNLGAALQRLGRTERAIAAYREAMRRDPALIEPCLNLGRLDESRGDLVGAAACYRAALPHHPRDGTLAHLLAAVEGRNTQRAPGDYVATLFDGLATQFDRHLVDDLEYRVPGELVAIARPALEGVAPVACVLDLGCGTGLVGVALAGIGARITGVDLSPRMLELACKRGVYERLVQADALEALAQAEAGSFHAVLAADVLVYFGALEEVFRGAARALAPGGVFAFSIEAQDGGSYRLQPTGRYAHALEYLRGLSAATGLTERHASEIRIRREKRGYARGHLAAFAKPRG